ncbi:MAG: hypothetical protein Q9179_002355 [Wetmoreana sp. 5 TL-2023]
MVDDLRKRSAPTHSVGIAAAYCSFKERDMQSPENLLAGLCVQLIDRSELVPETLVQLHKVHNGKRTRPNLKEILKVFEEVAKPFETTYLIVDALDECSTEVRDILLRELKALQHMITLLVTTRPIDSITGQFAENDTIEIRASHNDLEKYVQSSCRRSSRLSTLLQGRDMLVQEISDRVIDKANGMFLAAKLHMDSLSTKTNVKALKKAIRSLPKETDELYDEVFYRIDSQGKDDQELAVKALRWVAYAYRALNVRELKEALAIEPGDRDFDSDAMPEIALVLEACAGLLIVEKETEQVRLVHYTAQGYLDALLASRYQGAHALIGGDCITYLSYIVFQQSDDESANEGDDESDDEAGDDLTYYLLEYASEFWAKHCTAGHGVNLSAQLYNFLASNPRVRLDTPGFYYDFPVISPADLYTCSGVGIAAYFGLDNALRRLLQDEVYIDKIAYRRFSPMHLAAWNDEVVSVETLLEYGANIDCYIRRLGTPLSVAVRYKSIKAAFLLVHKGADVIGSGRAWDQPFAAVTWGSPIPFLQLLLNHGADINCMNGETQLMRRARLDDLETARWLLEKGALVNLKSHYYEQSALLAAAEIGSIAMVNLLLEYGADPRSVDRHGQTFLHTAWRKGNVALVKQFLGLGLDIDATDTDGKTAPTST